MKTITELEARIQLSIIIEEAIAGLPTSYRGVDAKLYIADSITRFRTMPAQNLYLEFGSSFHVTGSLNVTAESTGMFGEVKFVATVSTASGIRTLATSIAVHNLMGRLIDAATTIQAAADGLPQVERNR